MPFLKIYFSKGSIKLDFIKIFFQWALEFEFKKNKSDFFKKNI